MLGSSSRDLGGDLPEKLFAGQRLYLPALNLLLLAFRFREPKPLTALGVAPRRALAAAARASAEVTPPGCSLT